MMAGDLTFDNESVPASANMLATPKTPPHGHTCLPLIHVLSRLINVSFLLTQTKD